MAVKRGNALVCVVVMAVDVKDVKNVGDVVHVVVADSDVDISADVDSTPN